jgi:hypothetical protein
LQEPPHFLKQLEIFHRFDSRALALHQKRNRIHAESGYAELQPITDDLVELVEINHVTRVEIGLKFVKAVKVELARFTVHVHVVFCTGGNTMPLAWSRGRFSLQTYQSRKGESGSARAD